MHFKKGFIGLGALIAIVLAVMVVGGGAYYVMHQNSASQPSTDSSLDNAQTLPSNTNQTQPSQNTVNAPATTAGSQTTTSAVQYKTITNATLGVSFEVPTEWIDYGEGADEFLDPKSLGDGVDGYSFSFDVSASSVSFSSLLSPNTADHFAQLQALPNGNVMKAAGKDVGNGSPLSGEEFTKVANLSVVGYPAIHFHIIDGTSYEWGTREMQDGYWVQAGSRNLFFYFGSVDSAKKYTYATEASVMQHTLASIHINTQTSSSDTGSASVAGMTKYTDTSFGFSFWYPSGWTVSQLPISSSQYSGGTIVKRLLVAGGKQQNNIEIDEMHFASGSITTPDAGCMATYSFSATGNQWMQTVSGCDQPTATTAYNQSAKTMGGLPTLFSQNGISTQSYFVPLSGTSATNALLVSPMGSYVNLIPTINTIAATDASAATPVSATQQQSVIQTEANAYVEL